MALRKTVGKGGSENFSGETAEHEDWVELNNQR